MPEPDLMNRHHANLFHDRLLEAGYPTPIKEVDHAIQSCAERMAQIEGRGFPNLDNERVWWELEPQVLEHLGLDEDALT